MSLPSGLSAYEFRRVLVPSQDLPRYYHLRLEKGEDGAPLLLPEGRPRFAPIDIRGFFGRSGPVEVEVGCGKGGFMVEYCGRHPQIPFLGIEWESEIAYLAAGRVAKRPALQHARVLLGDAFYFFRDYMPAESVGAFHIYFPDPWPKKRHHKNRIVRPEFLEQVRRLAVPGARLNWATDHHRYNAFSREQFAGLGWLEVEKDDAPPTEGIMTNFEKKYRLQGKAIYRASLRVRK